MTRYLFPNSRRADVSWISSPITHRALSEHQAITAWQFYRPLCAVAPGHISVQTQDRWPALPSGCAGARTSSWEPSCSDGHHSTCPPVLHSTGRRFLGSSKRFKVSALRSSKVCSPSARAVLLPGYCCKLILSQESVPPSLCEGWCLMCAGCAKIPPRLEGGVEVRA